MLAAQLPVGGLASSGGELFDNGDAEDGGVL
jgi:hypothetical protein